MRSLYEKYRKLQIEFRRHLCFAVAYKGVNERECAKARKLKPNGKKPHDHFQMRIKINAMVWKWCGKENQCVYEITTYFLLPCTSNTISPFTTRIKSQLSYRKWALKAAICHNEIIFFQNNENNERIICSAQWSVIRIQIGYNLIQV